MEWHHVFPTNDAIEHDTESLFCACNPEVDYKDCLVVHNRIGSIHYTFGYYIVPGETDVSYTTA